MSGVVCGERLEGKYGWVQHVSVPDDPMAQIQVSSWFMHLPGQGIGWDKFLLSVISLRDLPGRVAAQKRYPGAEFELVVLVLSPDHHPVVDEVETWMPMDPPNVVVQFHGISEAAAARVVRSCAVACVHGHLPAETQIYVKLADGSDKMMYLKDVLDMWESAVLKTVQHEQTGGLHERVN